MKTSDTQRIIVGISGASGAVYARRVLQLLVGAGVEAHLVASDAGRRLLRDEINARVDDLAELVGPSGERVILHGGDDIGAPIASGSLRHDGMIIVPCSCNTLASVAAGLSGNLLQRAAAVTLKERRRLVLCYREMPISPIDARNILTVTDAGAIVAPASPGFYLGPTTIDDLVDFVAARLLDLVDVAHGLDVRWDQHIAAEREAR
ncbi:MAG: UbiX family flavin prenyltransferase [Phycisphaerales bacterium]|nr:UbiX family flavin prenyltransferase [Phycisphaerales bacterium]